MSGTSPKLISLVKLGPTNATMTSVVRELLTFVKKRLRSEGIEEENEILTCGSVSTSGVGRDPR